MRDRYVPRVGRVSSERLLKAVAVADEAFWLTLVEELPEIVSGDVPPMGLRELEEVRNSVVISFVENNHDPFLSPHELSHLGYVEDAVINEYELTEAQHKSLAGWRERNCV